MALRLEQISIDVSAMTQQMTGRERWYWLQQARQLVGTVDETTLHRKLAARKQRVPWLVALPRGAIGEPVPCPPCPSAFRVIAADGSMIPPDRHSPVRYYVLNHGTAILEYGDEARATLDSQATFCYQEQDMFVDPVLRRFPLEGNRLSAKMQVAELRALREVAYTTPPPVVALLDGTLILWMIQAEPKEVKDRLLEEFCEHLAWFEQHRIPVVGYISDPGSYELGNTLRVYLCPEPGEGCRICLESEAPEVRLCHELRNFRDPALLGSLLGPGERTCLFESASEILSAYGPHQIQFCYLRTCDMDGQAGEVVRLEMPAWVAEDQSMLALVHAVLCDQCRRSGAQPPYPPALHEAHEQAVISASDRHVVEALVTEALARQRVTYLKSAKARHKRSRGV